jgi:pSer/pThr/pTyr-binding forkhead associated (FHA) protein
MNRPLALVGASRFCQIRLNDAGASRFVCGLILTPLGLWVSDLLSGQGIQVNGVRCEGARLEDGDRLEIGVEGVSLRIFYGSSRTAILATTSSTASASALARLRSNPAELAASLVPGLLKPLFDAESSQAGGADPTGEALLLMIRLLGEIHREHVVLIRDELERIRELSREMAQVKRLLGPSPPGTSPTLPGPRTEAPTSDQEPGETRLDPATVHDLVGERLAEWERERESRWGKVVSLLMGP